MSKLAATTVDCENLRNDLIGLQKLYIDSINTSSRRIDQLTNAANKICTTLHTKNINSRKNELEAIVATFCRSFLEERTVRIIEKLSLNDYSKYLVVLSEEWKYIMYWYQLLQVVFVHLTTKNYESKVDLSSFFRIALQDVVLSRFADAIIGAINFGICRYRREEVHDLALVVDSVALFASRFEGMHQTEIEANLKVKFCDSYIETLQMFYEELLLHWPNPFVDTALHLEYITSSIKREEQILEIIGCRSILESSVNRTLDALFLIKREADFVTGSNSIFRKLLHERNTDTIKVLFSLYSRFDLEIVDKMAKIVKDTFYLKGLSLLKERQERGEKAKGLLEEVKLKLRQPGLVKEEAEKLIARERVLKKDVENRKDINFIDSLIQFSYIAEQMIETCFQSKIEVKKALNEAFSNFLLAKHNLEFSIPVLIANYIDHLLRPSLVKSAPPASPEWIYTASPMQKIEKAIQLLVFAKGALVFYPEHVTLLKDRLLLPSVLDDEKTLETMLSKSVGAVDSKANKSAETLSAFVASDILRNKFSEWLASRKSSSEVVPEMVVTTIEGTVDWKKHPKLLTAPCSLSKSVAQVSDDVYLPPQLASLRDTYYRWWRASPEYKNQFTHLALDLGKVQLSAKFDKEYTLDLLPVQASLLLVISSFEDETIDVKKLSKLTNLPESVVIRYSSPMVFAPQCRLLTKVPREGEVVPTSRLSVNKNFSSPNVRVNVVPPIPEVVKPVVEELLLDEKLKIIDAFIVREMKQKKQMPFDELFEVVSKKITTFAFNYDDFKKRIEALVDDDYLEREEASQQLLKYVA